jgi:hypothetical protein
MDISATVVLSLCMIMGTFIAVVGMVLDHEKKKARKNAEPPRPPAPTPSRTSVLAAFSFLSGLFAILMVTASSILAACVSLNEVTGIPESMHAPLNLAARIVLWCSLLPTVSAVALALGARGSIKESRETVGGRSLYRTGLFLSILSGVMVLDAKVVNPANWVSLGSPGGAGGPGGTIFSRMSKSDPNRGYLGVEHETASGVDGVRILRVLPGTPAERAGLQSGDRIVQIDGLPVTAGESLPDRIGSVKPGTKVELSVRRGDGVLHLTAVLAQPFRALREMFEDANRDSERISLLKALSPDHRFTASELKAICETFSFDTSREEAATMALPKLVDPDNAYQILSTFNFSTTKESMSRRIAELLQSKK